jgi:hypothetical protein
MNIVAEDNKTSLFRDPNTLYKLATHVGSVERVYVSEDSIVIIGELDAARATAFGLDSLIALDGAGRYVGMTRILDGGGTFKIPKKDVGRDNAALTVTIYALSAEHNFIYPLSQSPSRQTAYADLVRKWLPADSVDVPSLRKKLAAVISEAVKTPYISTSIHAEIKTGNSYQTLSLGDGKKTSGRQDRMAYLRQIEFRNKSVLDLGANTGEMSRSARALGASLVDGYEYDPYFVEIGRAVNALVGTTRVSLFQDDCTRPAIYKDLHYDIVLALNVWVYIEGVMSVLKDVAPIFVFETHTLDHGMNFYYNRLARWFSVSACIGLTDMGEDPHKSRAFLVLANNPAVLEAHFQQEFVEVKPYYRNVFLEKTGVLDQRQALDLATKCFAERSEENWGNVEYCSFGRAGYFESLLAGFHQYLADGSNVTDENFYLRFFAHGVTEGVIDNKMKNVVENTKWLKRKVANKFEDMHNIIFGFPHRVPPIRLVQQDGGALKFITSAGETIFCNEVDGHHRFFTAQLLGVERLHCQVVRR